MVVMKIIEIIAAVIYTIGRAISFGVMSLDALLKQIGKFI